MQIHAEGLVVAIFDAVVVQQGLVVLVVLRRPILASRDELFGNPRAVMTTIDHDNSLVLPRGAGVPEKCEAMQLLSLSGRAAKQN